METAPLCGDYNNYNYSSSHSVLSKDKKMFMQDLFTHANTNVRTQTTEQYNKYNQTFFSEIRSINLNKLHNKTNLNSNDACLFIYTKWHTNLIAGLS